MIIIHPSWESEIELNPDGIFTITVENPSLLAKYVMQLREQLGGSDGFFAIYDGDTPIAMSHNVSLVVDPFSCSANEKSILSSVDRAASAYAVSEQRYLDSNAVVSSLSRSVEDLLSEMDPLLEIDVPSYAAIMKIMNIHFVQSTSLVERLSLFLDASSKFCGTKVFIFINLRSFIDGEVFQEFVKHITYHKYHVLFFESSYHPPMRCEGSMIVDNTLCEIRSSSGGECNI